MQKLFNLLVAIILVGVCAVNVHLLAQTPPLTSVELGAPIAIVITPDGGKPTVYPNVRIVARSDGYLMWIPSPEAKKKQEEKPKENPNPLKLQNPDYKSGQR